MTVELNGAEPEPTGLDLDEIDVTTFSNTEGLKHGLSANFVDITRKVCILGQFQLDQVNCGLFVLHEAEHVLVCVVYEL